MAVDYDLVVIGGTIAARQAAIAAVNLQARVALVLPPIDNYPLHSYTDLFHHALGKIAKSNRINQLRLEHPVNYPWIYAKSAIDRLATQNSPALLGARGIDVILGNGEFCRRPHFAFHVERRYLRARKYLVATGTIPPRAAIPGLSTTGYLTAYHLPTLVDRPIPRRWAIIGEEVVGVELAQTLAYLGCEVKLIVSTEQILPQEDPAISQFLQAQLEADGVEIYLNSPVTRVSLDREDRLIEIDTEKIIVDTIFLALPDRPAIEGLNLAGIGVDYDDTGIGVDRHLQTSHHRVYACGGVCGNILGGYRGDRVTIAEAETAVNNALLGHKTRVKYQDLPWAVHTDPPLARIGISPAEATLDRRKLILLDDYFKIHPQPIFDNSPSGFLQLVVTPRGKILGATIIGERSLELIQFFTLAIHQEINIDRLIDLPGLSPAYTDIIHHTIKKWQVYRDRERVWRDRWRRWRMGWKRQFTR